MSGQNGRELAVHKSRHHLLFQGRHWNVGRAKEMRNFFVYKIDQDIHNELHNHVVHDVPRPAPLEMSRLYDQFTVDRWRLEGYDIFEALDWLQHNCDCESFNRAIQKQIDFLKKHPP